MKPALNNLSTALATEQFQLHADSVWGMGLKALRHSEEPWSHDKQRQRSLLASLSVKAQGLLPHALQTGAQPRPLRLTWTGLGSQGLGVCDLPGEKLGSTERIKKPLV